MTKKQTETDVEKTMDAKLRWGAVTSRAMFLKVKSLLASALSGNMLKMQFLGPTHTYLVRNSGDRAM